MKRFLQNPKLFPQIVRRTSNIKCYPELHLDMVMDTNDKMNKYQGTNKINTVIGVYRTETGAPYNFNSVKKAEESLITTGLSHDYEPIIGNPKFIDLTSNLYFGVESQKLCYRGLQTVGGTGALSLAASFMKRVFSNPVVHVPNPTWENHIHIFKNANVMVKQYSYLFPKNEKSISHPTNFDFSQLSESIKNIPNGEAVLLHGCAQNPTGYDLTSDQWNQLINVCISKQLYIIIDLAYLGFASGNIEKDRIVLTILKNYNYPSLVCTSYSKNFGLYSERVGSIFVCGADNGETQQAHNVLKGLVRTSYSNPPSFGSKIITKILETPELKCMWEHELLGINQRYVKMRHKLRTVLEEKLHIDFSSITNQTGMFWYAREHLTSAQILAMRNEGIFFLENGRISIAGINNENFDRFVKIFVDVHDY